MKKITLLFLISNLFSFCSCSNSVYVDNAIVYLVHDSCINYGKIEGNQWQAVLIGEYSSNVTAVANNGYIFIEWSDGNKNPSRTDAAKNGVNGPVVYYAYFGVIND